MWVVITYPCPKHMMLAHYHMRYSVSNGKVCIIYKIIFNMLILEVNSNTESTYIPDSKVRGSNMGPTWGRQDPREPHVGTMNLVIRDVLDYQTV